MALKFLPTQVPEGWYRFPCSYVRHDILKNTLTVMINDEEVTVPARQIVKGLAWTSGNVINACDITTAQAVINKLI